MLKENFFNILLYQNKITKANCEKHNVEKLQTHLVKSLDWTLIFSECKTSSRSCLV